MLQGTMITPTRDAPESLSEVTVSISENKLKLFYLMVIGLPVSKCFQNQIHRKPEGHSLYRPDFIRAGKGF